MNLLKIDRDRDRDPIPSLLPASYRTQHDDLAPATLDAACIARELDLRRLHRVASWLWVAGRPMPPRPLHYQLLLGREIFVTEQMDMHLVWTTGRIFLKPLPRFLLEPRFWTDHLAPAEAAGARDGIRAHAHPVLWRCALGFLFSYAALITHESDLLIAQEKHLIPAEVGWPAWRILVAQLDTEHIYPRIDERFHYGELRLSRLNKIYVLSQRPILRGYMSQWQQYGSFFQDNFAWLASATVFIAIVLTAMQVGLATKTLADNDAFQSASYGFTVFSILGPLVAAGLIFLAFCCMFINNWAATAAYRTRRFRHMRLRPGKA